MNGWSIRKQDGGFRRLKFRTWIKSACRAKQGFVRTVPKGLEPGSDVAQMSVLGYDPMKYYSGRAPIEAVARNIKAVDE